MMPFASVSGTAMAQSMSTKNVEDALKKTGANDHVDPEYVEAMGHHSAVGAAGTLLKVNHASEKQLSAYDNFFKENAE